MCACACASCRRVTRETHKRANARTRGTKKARQPVSAPAGARAYLMRANVALAPSGLKSSSLCLSMCCSALDCRWIINRRCAPRGAREAQPLRRAAPSACGAHRMPGGGGGPAATALCPLRARPRAKAAAAALRPHAPRPSRRPRMRARLAPGGANTAPCPRRGVPTRPFAPLLARPRPHSLGAAPCAPSGAARARPRVRPHARARACGGWAPAGVCDNQRMCTF